MTVEMKDLNGVINWTKKYFEDAGIKKAIVGISGGIDSAVVASICVRALGSTNVLGVALPCYSQRLDGYLAERLARSLNINMIGLDLEETFDYLWADYRKSAERTCIPLEYNKLVPANIKARLRMTALYAFAGHINGLVVGTTNKTEALIGYATKYGDGASDIEPLQDFYKGEVYELAEILNDIPSEIIERDPTAGLWEGQTDEGELGMPYPKIDLALRVILKDFIPGDEILINEEMENRIDKLKSLIAANKHKEMHLPYYKR